jgi:hypothetical protein
VKTRWAMPRAKRIEALAAIKTLGIMMGSVSRGPNAGHQRRGRISASDKPCMKDMLIAPPLHAFVWHGGRDNASQFASPHIQEWKIALAPTSSIWECSGSPKAASVNPSSNVTPSPVRTRWFKSQMKVPGDCSKYGSSDGMRVKRSSMLP